MRAFFSLIILTFLLATATAVNLSAAISDPDSLAARRDTLTLQGVSVTAKSPGRRVAEGVFNVNALTVTPSVNLLTTVSNIIDRSPGIKIRRQGGVGSDYELSINGLSGNSIRYFIDGRPLETQGSGLSLDNIPINTIDRVEIYKGVVPTSFGIDALGGVVNIVTKNVRRNFLDASIGGGSFHTFGADFAAQWFIPGSPVAIRPTFSYSSSKNDYMMHDVEVWDDIADRFVLADRPRFHDDYRSLIAQLEVAVNPVSWADKLSVAASLTNVDKDIQTGAMQNKVYGLAERQSRARAISARWAKRFGNLSARLDISYTHDRSVTIDSAWRKYDWNGNWLPSSGNEITGRARSIRVYNRPLTALNTAIDYSINSSHNIALNYSLNRRGNKRYDRLDKNFEPSDDYLTKHILALNYSQQFLNGRLINSFFFKTYINVTDIRQTDNLYLVDIDNFRPKATNAYPGGGLGSRFTLCDAISFKASAEHSVRLPLSRELLGNGVTIQPNLNLSPEESNNFNIGIFGSLHPAPGHTLRYEINGFIRRVDNYIRARISERDGMMQYTNEPAIDIKGFDFDLSWSLRNTLAISFNGSWSDARDLKRYKTDGNPSATYRNRVPNRPWLFANAEASYSLHDIFLRHRGDRLRLSISEAYIHWYFLNWEAYGAVSSKARIPTQWATDIALTYSWDDDRFNFSLSAANIFDRRLYDNYMLQKPGRAFMAKFRISL